MPLAAARDTRRALTAVLSALFLALAMLTIAAPAAHAAGGTVTGVVTNSVGTPLDSADVYLFNPADEEEYYESTNGTGHFTFTGVPAGAYKLFVDEFGTSVGTYFPSAATYAEAGTVTVTTGNTTTANVQMIKASSIAGKVTKPGGAAAADAQVIVYRSYNGSWQGVDGTETTSSGNYTFNGLPAGSYVVGARLNGFQRTYSGNVHTLAEATPITLASGATVTNADLALEAGGAISGTVKDRTGTAARGVEIKVSNGSGTVEYTETNGTGNYTVTGLPAGSYTVATNDTSRYTRSSTTATVTVPSTTANVNLTVIKYSTVTGTVRDHTGANVSYGDISVFQKVGSKFVFIEAYTDIDNGTYSLPLAPGTYRILAQQYGDDEEEDAGDSTDAPTFFGNVLTLEAATDIKVNSYEDTVGGKNIQLVQGGTITGTITLPAGVEFDEDDYGIPVEVVNPSTGSVVAATYSDGDYYEVGGLAPGSYKVQFARGGNITPLAGQYYNGVSESAGLAAATPVTVTKGQVKTGINATLTKGKELTGKVLQVDGDPAPGCLVQAYTSDGHLSDRYAYTKADGTFTVQGLSTGDVDVAVHPVPYSPSTGDEGTDYAWDCVGLTNPDDDSLPGSGYYSAADGTLAMTEKNLRSVTITNASTAMPVDLQFATPSGSVQNLTAPMITGAPIVGNELTAGAGTWDPSDVDLHYDWRIGQYSVGEDEPTFTPTPSMVGEQITVSVTAIAEGKASSTVTSAPTAAVAAEAFIELENATMPKITGTAKVGQVLSANNGTWTPTGPDLTFTYQWLRNGATIVGATKAKYTAVAADLGAQIRVKVTAQKPGALNRSKTTAPTTTVKAGTLVTKGGSVSGRAKVGKKLKATAPSCTPGATVKYRWLRNGSPIAGATKASYKVKSADKRKKLSVKITLTRSGYATVVKTIKAGKVS